MSITIKILLIRGEKAGNTIKRDNLLIPLHPLLKATPHMAYKVSSLARAIENHAVILGPYEPIDGYRVAVTDNAGVPGEFIETDLPDEVIWAHPISGVNSSLYRQA